MYISNLNPDQLNLYWYHEYLLTLNIKYNLINHHIYSQISSNLKKIKKQKKKIYQTHSIPIHKSAQVHSKTLHLPNCPISCTRSIHVPHPAFHERECKSHVNFNPLTILDFPFSKSQSSTRTNSSHHRWKRDSSLVLARLSSKFSQFDDENVENVLLRMITRVQLENVCSPPDCKRATIPS